MVLLYDAGEKMLGVLKLVLYKKILERVRQLTVLKQIETVTTIFCPDHQ